MTFDTLDEVVGDVEWIDVSEGVFDLWDSRAAKLELKAVGYDVSVAGFSVPTDVSTRQLRETLLSFIRAVPLAASRLDVKNLEGADLAELVRVIHEFNRHGS